jgi:hypothetical protein
VRAWAWGALAAVAIAAPGAGCNGGGVVGGECAPGFVACGAECVDVAGDALNCGACDLACGPGARCDEGACVGGVAGAGDGGGPAGANRGGAAGRGAAGEWGGEGGIAGEGGRGAESGGGGASGAEAGAPGGGGAGGGQAGAPGAAGAGGAEGPSGEGGAGPGAAGAAGAFGGGGAGAGGAGEGGQGGAGPCAPPLVLCDGACVDLRNDEFNCGACGRVCPTGVCQAGVCYGARAGHEVVIGFDYAAVPAASFDPKRLLGNAVFLNAAQASGSWRVLGFDPHDSPTRAAVDAIVAQQAPSYGVVGLTVERAVDAADLVGRLSAQAFDALLVYDAPGAPPGALAQEGAAAQAALRSFSSAGGSVVVLGGGGGVNEMWAFVRAAGVQPATGSSPVALPATLRNEAPTDAVGVGVATLFAARPHAAAWLLEAPDGAVVVATAAGGRPVVVHRSVLPP